MALPRNTQREPPDVMAMRILPFDVFGTFIDTAEAIVFADTDRPRRRDNGRTRLLRVNDVCDGMPAFCVTTDVDVATEGSSMAADDGGVEVVDVGEPGEEAGSLGADVGAVDGGTVGANVVVGTTFSTPTVAALDCGALDVSTPTWPYSLLPQHFTAPVLTTAHACRSPATSATT